MCVRKCIMRRRVKTCRCRAWRCVCVGVGGRMQWTGSIRNEFPEMATHGWAELAWIREDEAGLRFGGAVWWRRVKRLLHVQLDGEGGCGRDRKTTERGPWALTGVGLLSSWGLTADLDLGIFLPTSRSFHRSRGFSTDGSQTTVYGTLHHVRRTSFNMATLSTRLRQQPQFIWQVPGVKKKKKKVAPFVKPAWKVSHHASFLHLIASNCYNVLKCGTTPTFECTDSRQSALYKQEVRKKNFIQVFFLSQQFSQGLNTTEQKTSVLKWGSCTMVSHSWKQVSEQKERLLWNYASAVSDEPEEIWDDMTTVFGLF